MAAVYRLRDPRNNAVRWIGLTKVSLGKRLTMHCHGYERSPRWEWICDLKSDGRKPLIEHVATVPDGQHYMIALTIEWAVAEWELKHGAPLLNLTFLDGRKRLPRPVYVAPSKRVA